MKDGMHGLQIAPIFPNWTNSWYSRTNDIGDVQNYTINLTEPTKLTLNFDFYVRRMYPHGCKVNNSIGKVRIYD